MQALFDAALEVLFTHLWQLRTDEARVLRSQLKAGQRDMTAGMDDATLSKLAQKVTTNFRGPRYGDMGWVVAYEPRLNAFVARRRRLIRAQMAADVRAHA